MKQKQNHSPIHLYVEVLLWDQQVSMRIYIVRFELNMSLCAHNSDEPVGCEFLPELVAVTTNQMHNLVNHK